MTFTQGFIATAWYLLIVFAVMQNVVWLGVVAIVWFTLRFGAVSLLPLAILLDGYYGAFFSVPVLSISAIVWYVASELFRVRSNIVQSKYE